MTHAPPVWRLQVYETLASTADLCRSLAAAGEPEGLAILAMQQTAGRGSHGRGWESPPGNLYLSVLLRPVAPMSEAPGWALLASVAVADALSPWLPAPGRLRLKWPNDILLDEGKLAGVLVEAADDGAGRMDWLTIGMGVNLATAPMLSDRPTACVGPTAPPPEILARGVLARLDARRAEAFAVVRAAWLARGPALGNPVRLRLGDEIRHGVFAGLADDGRLLLREGDTVRAFAAGET